MDETCGTHVGEQVGYKILLGKPKGNCVTSGYHGGEDVDIFFLACDIRVYTVSLRAEQHRQRPRHRREDTIKMDLTKWFVRIWNGLNWLRTVSSGGLLLSRNENSGFM
jgi:hypothetical protein